ncbi:50S ribosomal protein L18 [Candidatus Woesearchaeota archaeon]|nr:50S ribosomal protein L18 [Candidatus Woesearchaeota archaeon]
MTHPKTIHFRRKREGRTNYKKRLHLLLSGKPRVVVRFTNQQVIAQVLNFTGQGDIVVTGVSSFELRKMGWKYSCKNIPAAYLTGVLVAKRALAAGCSYAILDTGLLSPLHKGRVYAFLKGVLDGGLEVPNTEEGIFPSEERLSGKHIENYGHALAPKAAAYTHQFSQYLKNTAKPENISAAVKTVKQKIQGQ